MQTEPVTIKSAHKKHICSWCGTRINVGESYIRYRWFDGGDVGTVKQHPECYDAMNELIDFEGSIEFNEGDNPRGCNCGHSKGCERCKAMDSQK